jgi:formylglycine-generating enzyme
MTEGQPNTIRLGSCLAWRAASAILTREGRTMTRTRIVCPPAALAVALCLYFSACGGRTNVQCVQDSNCDQVSGGVCTTAATGNRWCAYADPSCPSGYRYSGIDVGDSLGGICVAAAIDAGIDGAGADASGASAASCKGLSSNCGHTATDDCCVSPSVPGGTFYRGYDLGADTYSGNMLAPATIGAFRLDRYEVTVGRFRTFVSAHRGTADNPPATGAGAHPSIPGSGWSTDWIGSLLSTTAQLTAALNCDMYATWTDLPQGNENRPINCVSWYEAMAFCAWDGGYLPSEAEWNFAAAGGDAQRSYPWSSNPVADPSDGSYADDAGHCLGDGAPACSVTDLVEVGSKINGGGRWGHYDLGGNVYEWTLDANGAYPLPCTDCARLSGSTLRVLRGGSFRNPDLNMRTGVRGADPAAARESIVGLRCARPAM